MIPILRCGLILAWATTQIMPVLAVAVRDEVYPASPFVVDVTQPPYGARGDGQSDDTDAIQRAINEHTGQHKVLQFPRGTYVISRTLTWPKKWRDHENWGFTALHGVDPVHCRILLKDGTFPDETKPGAMMFCGGFGSADWFHNYIDNLTFDIGRSNAAAIALQFYSNNSGAIRNCRFLASEGTGRIGLDLGHRDMNGPLLVQHCEVRGFQTGISTGGAVNSQTFEDILLRDQRGVGFENSGQPISIRRLTSENSVPALKTYGLTLLVDSLLIGKSSANGVPAVINYNGGGIFLRHVRTPGYRRALGDVQTPDANAAFQMHGPDKPGSEGPYVAEYSTRPYTHAFPGPNRSLGLPVAETPSVPWDSPQAWANVDAFGADPTGSQDSSAAIQKATDSGATTLFLPGSYRIQSTVHIRGNVRRVVGLGGMINYGKAETPAFFLETGDGGLISLEHFGYVGGGIQISSPRPVLIQSVSDCPILEGPGISGGEWYLEDVVTHHLTVRGRKVWARQLNIENEGTHLVNDGGTLWVLGYKTERGGTLLQTLGGGRSEMLGGFSYTTTAGQLGPMFETLDSQVYAYFGEVCFNGDPFSVLVRETRNGETRNILRGKGTTTPYAAVR